MKPKRKDVVAPQPIAKYEVATQTCWTRLELNQRQIKYDTLLLFIWKSFYSTGHITVKKLLFQRG